MLQITEPEQQEHARLLKEAFATYRANQDLISVGAYRMGADPNVDRAINSQNAIKDFVRQPLTERVGFEEGLATLSRVANDALVTQTIEPAGQGVSAQAPQLPQVR
jgi:flagellum-specific ATP synthase